MSSKNRELELAGDFIQYTDRNIFLTGKAGTGKTTFLHNLAGKTAKRMIITAPTGVAAINAGGVTLHSFFQLPFGPYIPGSEAYQRNQQRQFRFSKEKKGIIKTLDLLVIDEISMVRADLLDAVDAVLRRFRYSELPFGGVQLLMIGDLHQLSPVARPDEWRLLQDHYSSVYFFSSNALARTRLITIELKHIYRQTDDRFIKLLNQVRNNSLDSVATAALNERHISGFIPDEQEGYITLTTHNRSAESINQTRLKALDCKEKRCRAEISGDFPEQVFPTPATLILKKGAQVMFVRNDMSPDKRFYNGKIGKISKISSESITVICPDENEPIKVKPVVWENIKYSLNSESGIIEEDKVGEFVQFPLKLAWAITIHKSQGLTFEKAVIDAQASFAHGQVYVALSRCKTMEGMVLSTPISGNGVATDKAVLSFDSYAEANPPNKEQLLADKISYQQKLLLVCFDLGKLSKHFDFLAYLLRANSKIVQVSGISCDFQEMEQRAIDTIFSVSENFKNQLQEIFQADSLPEVDEYVLERISKASTWFQEKFAEIFGQTVDRMHVDTDNSELRKKITSVLNNCKRESAIKLAGIKSCGDGFSPERYLQAVTKADLDFVPEKAKKSKLPEYNEADLDNPELFTAMKEWRSSKAKELDIAQAQIIHLRVLIQIASSLPGSRAALRKIRGVGPKTVKNYGDELLGLIREYREK